MKTGVQMVQDAYTVINVPAFTDFLSGDIYLFERPANSDKIDAVLNTLVLPNEQLQRGVFNFNIHLPNEKNVVINGKSDNSIPDVGALIQLTNIAAPLFADYVGYDFRCSLQNTGLPTRDVDNNWYVNFRVDYTAFQNNYRNI